MINEHTTILITGASRGIGRAAALLLARYGCRLILTCRQNTAALNKTADIARAFGSQCLTFTADASDYDAMAAIFAAAKEQFGSIDVLINNAGISHIGLFTDMTPSQWQHIMRTNTESVFTCCHLSIPAMVHKKSGCIINISSVWGNVGASCEAVYSASKGAIASFTKALAKELAPSGITVNAIAFGAIDTEMNQCLSEDERTALADEIPACRFGSPDEAAQLICQLIDAPKYLTGQVITMDGGWI